MIFLIALIAFFSLSAFALTTGEPAPGFTLKCLKSKIQVISLSDFKGKIIALE